MASFARAERRRLLDRRVHEIQGMPPSRYPGTKADMPVVAILDIKNDKIATEREYMDIAHMMQQLGVMQAPA